MLISGRSRDTRSSCSDPVFSCLNPKPETLNLTGLMWQALYRAPCVGAPSRVFWVSRCYIRGIQALGFKSLLGCKCFCALGCRVYG